VTTFGKIRVALLLVVLAAAGIRYAQVRRAERWTPTWSSGEQVALVLLVSSGASQEDTAAVNALREFAIVGSNKATFWALSDWFEREHRRYAPERKLFAPVVFDVKGPLEVAGAPPVPPRGAEEMSFLERWRRSDDFFAWFDAARARVATTAPSTMYVYFYPASAREGWKGVHSVADRRGRRGFVFVPLDGRGIETTLIDVAHETLHLFGATDKYDGAQCRFPEGYADPFLADRFAQRHAEVMAMGFPRAGGAREGALELFEQMRIGVATAAEIGWIDRDRSARYYAGDRAAGPPGE